MLSGCGPSAYWASWADCIPTTDIRHPIVAESLVRELEGHPHTPCLRAAQEAPRSLEGVLGWSPPSWSAVRNGARPDTHQPEEFEPSGKRGWQHEAASRVDQLRDDDLFVRLTDSGQALVRSQGGPGAGLALATCPRCRITRIEPQLFRILLFRRLNLPLPLSAPLLPVWPTTRSSWPPPGKLAPGLGSWEGGGARWRP